MERRAKPVVTPIRFLIGGKDYIDNNICENWFGIQYYNLDKRDMAIGVGHAGSEGVNFFFYLRPKPINYVIVGPTVVYFPAEHRTLLSPEVSFDFTGKTSDQFEFVQRWQPPESGPDPLIKRIYNLRWEDLSAKEEGRIGEANGFESYSRAFNRFFEGRKQLKWHRAELVVETKSGAIHDLSELSSGEKQVILFMGELLHRWRPGSLILIDEPELHLHESYQTKLWEALVDWQKERGGQVIVATQSAHLFGISDPGIKVLLSARRAQ